MTHMMKSRPLARLVARLSGYFWLPCPVCGTMFAGFESTGETVDKASPCGSDGRSTCPLCPGVWVQGFDGEWYKAKSWEEARDIAIANEVRAAESR